MNKLIVSLIALSMSGLASADKTSLPPPPSGFGFAGVGVGSGQYLGLYLSNPPAPVTPVKSSVDGGSVPPICNVGVQVLGMDAPSDNNPMQTINEEIAPGTTVFVPINASPVVGADPGVIVDPVDPTAPQYFNVSVKTPVQAQGKDKKNMGCVGLTGSLGVYEKTTQNLQVIVPMLPAPLK